VNPQIEFRSVGKRFWIHEPNESISAGGIRNRLWKRLAGRQEFWAVREVSFAVPPGQALGIIGRNGAGKTTLLKLLSGITSPTAGEIAIRGRLAALLEVGSGFHPELTGRENIFLSGSILGMRRQEIREKLEDIIEFAGIRSFIDVPVKRYSSGMFVRLGFAIAAQVDADVLLLDEVLAVGDAAFQEKCKARVLELKRSGMTIIFISHDLSAVREVCDRVIVMEQGAIRFDGEVSAAIAEYQRAGRLTRERAPALRSGQRLDVTAMTFLDENGHKSTEFRTAGAMRARIDFVAHHHIRDAGVQLLLYDATGACMIHLSTRIDGPRLDFPPGPGAIEFRCDELGLRPGSYRAAVVIDEHDDPTPVEELRDAALIEVLNGPLIQGAFHQAHAWRSIPVSEASSVEVVHQESAL
jgi:ABC-type polysaccharide/polyol phosphate transport system ATPase subunit